MKNKYVKIVLGNLTELTETAVANLIQQAGRALNGFECLQYFHLPDSSGDISHMSVC